MEVGRKVEVILSKDWVMVLRIIESTPNSVEKIICRTKTNEVVEFFKFELQEIK